MSRYSSLHDHAPLALYRNGKSVRALRYGRSLRAIKELMAKSGLNLDEFALHALRIFGPTTRAAGEDISKRVSRREGRRTSDAIKAYTRDSIQDSKRLSSKVVVTREVKKRQSWKGTAGGTKRYLVYSNSSLTLPRSWRSRMLLYHSEAW